MKDDIVTIVLTGGPHAGKSTVLNAILEEFSGNVTAVPETASLLLNSGFTAPGHTMKWTPEWQIAFERAITVLQPAIEDAMRINAEFHGHRLIVFDRGILDAAAYLSAGLDDLIKLGVDIQKTMERYDAVIHLESLATAKPELYGKAGNEQRFEPLERAQEIERTTREVWKGHKKHIILDGGKGVSHKISSVLGIAKFLMA